MRRNDRIIVGLHILGALLTAVALYISFKALIDVPQWIRISDAVLSGVLLSVLLVLLKYTVRYSHFPLDDSKQKVINYSSLAILFVFFWIGLDFLVLNYVVTDKDWNELIKTIPVRVLIGLLVYGLSVAVFGKLFKQNAECPEIEEECIKEDNLVEENQEPVSVVERITVKKGQYIEIIPVGEIIWLQAEGDYVMIFSTKGKFLKEQTMKSLESTLPSEQFVRVHRSSIVNVEYIAQIEQYDKHSQILKLKDGTQVRTSLAGYKLLKTALGL